MEIKTTQPTVIIQTPVVESERQFTMPDPTHEPELANFMTNALVRNLYSNPIFAFIRESIQNSIDAMRVNNTLDKGLYIHIPSKDNPKLFISDYGPGISKETFDTTYGQLGFSSKRNDNSLNGGYGIGRLTILAASEQGFITTINNGFKYVYFLSLRDNYTYQLLSQSPCSEPTGTTVEIVLDIVKNPSLIDSIVFYVYALTAFLDCPVTSNLHRVAEINSFCRSSFKTYSIPDTDISYKIKYQPYPSTVNEEITPPERDYRRLFSENKYKIAIQIGDITYYNLLEEPASQPINFYKDPKNILASKPQLNYVKLRGLGYRYITDLIDKDIHSASFNRTSTQEFIAKVNYNSVKEVRADSLDCNIVVIKIPPNYIQLSTNRDSWPSTEKDKINSLIISVFSHLSSCQNKHLAELYKPETINPFLNQLIQYNKQFEYNSCFISLSYKCGTNIEPSYCLSISQSSTDFSQYGEYNLYLPSTVDIKQATERDIYELTNLYTIPIPYEFIDYYSAIVAKLEEKNKTANLDIYPKYSVLLPTDLLTTNEKYKYLSEVYATAKLLKEKTRHRTNPLYTKDDLSDDWYYFNMPNGFFSTVNQLKNKEISNLFSKLADLTSVKLFMNSNIIFYSIGKDVQSELLLDNKVSFIKGLLESLPKDKPTILIPLGPLADEVKKTLQNKLKELPFFSLHPSLSFITVTSEQFQTAQLNSTTNKKEQKASQTNNLKKIINNKGIRQFIPSVSLVPRSVSSIYDYTEVCTAIPNESEVKYFMIAGHPGNIPSRAINLTNLQLIAPFIPKERLYLVTPTASDFLKTQDNWIEVESLYKQVIISMFKRYKELFESLNYGISVNFFTETHTSDAFNDCSSFKSCTYIWYIMQTAYKRLKSRPLKLLIELMDPDYIRALRRAVLEEYEDEALKELVKLLDSEYLEKVKEAKLNNSPAEYLTSLINYKEEVINQQNRNPRTSIIQWLLSTSSYLIDAWSIQIDNNEERLKQRHDLALISGLTDVYPRTLDYNRAVCPLYKLLFDNYPLLRWVFPILEASNRSRGSWSWSFLDMYPLDEILTYMESI